MKSVCLLFILAFFPFVFVCGQTSDSTFTDSRDGFTYKIVTIGKQTWFAENLRFNFFANQQSANNSVSLGGVTRGLANINSVMSGTCYKFETESKTQKYGLLYNWYAVNVLNVCPTGWHVPTDEEWANLIRYQGNESTAALQLKSQNGWTSKNGTNASGFNALPAGKTVSGGGSFYSAGKRSYFWTRTAIGEESDLYAWAFVMSFKNNQVSKNKAYRTDCFSVRCVRD